MFEKFILIFIKRDKILIAFALSLYFVKCMKRTFNDYNIFIKLLKTALHMEVINNNLIRVKLLNS
ncbi:hypothetical protein CGEO_1472 [Campylobacter geochelonis]|nr:hypothetical protein CGEO_1472 [Campylobacter geochelonis]